MDCSSPGSPVHGILQARTLEWVAMPTSGDLNQTLSEIERKGRNLTHFPLGNEYESFQELWRSKYNSFLIQRICCSLIFSLLLKLGTEPSRKVVQHCSREHFEMMENELLCCPRLWPASSHMWLLNT